MSSPGAREPDDFQQCNLSLSDAQTSMARPVTVMQSVQRTALMADSDELAAKLAKRRNWEAGSECGVSREPQAFQRAEKEQEESEERVRTLAESKAAVPAVVELNKLGRASDSQTRASAMAGSDPCISPERQDDTGASDKNLKTKASEPSAQTQQRTNIMGTTANFMHFNTATAINNDRLEPTATADAALRDKHQRAKEDTPPTPPHTVLSLMRNQR